MSFKQAIEIDKIQDLVRSINDHLDHIDEYGHCTTHSNEVPKLKERSEKLRILLEACDLELNNFSTEMIDWYSY